VLIAVGDTMGNLLNDVLNDVRHCRDRVEEVRIKAANMHDEIARRQMLSIAYGYGRFAERAEQRTKFESRASRANGPQQ
jgi:hypothetical protein